MNYIEIFGIAVALSMDAFSVSVCKGLTLKNVNLKNACIVGAYFGAFQAIMPFTGFVLADFFSEKVQSFGDIIAFVLLAVVGGQMIYNNVKTEQEDELEFVCYDSDKESLGMKVMLSLAVATSIDALATGVSFAMLQINIISTALFIGCTTFVISAVGVKIGSFVGEKFRKYAEIIGGVVLILIGFRIVLFH